MFLHLSEIKNKIEAHRKINDHPIFGFEMNFLFLVKVNDHDGVCGIDGIVVDCHDFGDGESALIVDIAFRSEVPGFFIVKEKLKVVTLKVETIYEEENVDFCVETECENIIRIINKGNRVNESKKPILKLIKNNDD